MKSKVLAVSAAALGLFISSAYATDPPNNQTGMTSHDNPAKNVNRSRDSSTAASRAQQRRDVTRQEMHNPTNNQTGERTHDDSPRSQAASGATASRRGDARAVTQQQMHNPVNNQTGAATHDESKAHGAQGARSNSAPTR